mgnify:CR=1 FL=1
MKLYMKKVKIISIILSILLVAVICMSFVTTYNQNRTGTVSAATCNISAENKEYIINKYGDCKTAEELILRLNDEICTEYTYHRPIIIFQSFDFDEFINHEGLEAVFLCNYFHEHTPYAIKALEKNIHVLSECTSNISMGEGVQLVRACEKSKAFYMIAENYPFMKFNQEMRKVYRSGVLGKALFCEGEYNHPIISQKEIAHYCPTSKHWRYHIPRIYYITHSLGPLMYITGAFPKRVTAMPVFGPLNEENGGGSLYWRLPDRSAVVTCLNDDDSVFRVTGWSHFGGHANTYRVCGELGQIENLRAEDNMVLLSFNEGQEPEGKERVSKYEADFEPEAKEAAEKAGHGGGDYGLVRDFVEAVASEDPGKLSSSIKDSIESHVMGFMAEKSRKSMKKVKI